MQTNILDLAQSAFLINQGGKHTLPGLKPFLLSAFF
jgi:hypothetical protein